MPGCRRWRQNSKRLLALSLLLTVGLIRYVQKSSWQVSEQREPLAGNVLAHAAARKIQIRVVREVAEPNQNCFKPVPKGFDEALSYDPKNVGKVPHFDTYAEALAHVADGNKIVMLSSFDYGYTDMAWNLYLSSIRPLNLTNHLFVCSDRQAMAEFERRGVPCFLFANGTAGTNSVKQSEYYTSEFKKKTRIKTKIMLDALVLGYTAVIIDIDIVLFKHPLPYLEKLCKDCDILIQDDMVELNSGFYLTRPTKAGIQLHEAMAKNEKDSSQKAMKKQLHFMVKTQEIKHFVLSRDDVPCGRHYFEVGKRMWPYQNPCKECVLVHNNWINTGQAKIYRFKEHLLWFIDRDRYYSSSTRKYITYENPLNFEHHKSVQYERQALLAALALGRLTNRTVILPTFSCDKCDYEVCADASAGCALNTQFRIDKLEVHFKDAYREHAFLCNPLVPGTIKSSISDVIYVNNSYTTNVQIPKKAHVVVSSETAKEKNGISLQKIQSLVHQKHLDRFSVLRFNSLYGIDIYKDGLLSKEFLKVLNKSIVATEYRNY